MDNDLRPLDKPEPMTLLEAAENLLTLLCRIGRVDYDMRAVLDDYETAKLQLADAIEKEKQQRGLR